MLKHNPAVCFSLVAASSYIGGDTPCNGTVRYASVIGRGTAQVVTDDAEKKTALAAIVAHYGGDDQFVYPPAALRAVTILRVDISRLTAKRNAG